MPTFFIFGSSMGVNNLGFGGADPADGTVAAIVDDGIISVGDEVTFSGFNSIYSTHGGISGGDGYYLGTGIFGGNTGYVFGESATEGANSSFFIVFDDDASTDFSTFISVSTWADGSAPQTLGVDAACFCAGSFITCDYGDCPVEDLRIGDVLRTANGGLGVVKWVGRQSVSTRFGAAERLLPVRFSAGSLGDGLPHTDLTVTADHGILVDGVICHAGALVNGTTITRVPLAEMGESFTVYHIETEEHEIILANGAPAETFIDNVSRRAFDNYAEFEALYGDVPEMEELPYPRAMSARQVPERIKAKLAGKAVA